MNLFDAADRQLLAQAAVVVGLLAVAVPLAFGIVGGGVRVFCLVSGVCA